MKVVATYNLKGGVGKTATAVNLAYLAASEGSRVLVWDLDAQGAASFYFRVKPKVKGGGKALVRGRRDLDDVVKGTDFENLDLVPGDFSYRNLDLQLERTKRPTRRLGQLLRPLRKEYDYVFLDCPPSISVASESVFEASDVLLVPLIPTTLSLRALDQLDAFLKKGTLRQPPKVLGFFSMVDRRRRLHRDVIDDIGSSRKRVLRSRIPSTSDVERMGQRRKPVLAYAPKSRAAAAYRDLWAEAKARI
jgi:cellulose biosynthesis protein BcsQ